MGAPEDILDVQHEDVKEQEVNGAAGRARKEDNFMYGGFRFAL